METKKCFKCGRVLPIEEFYKHPQMADGHLNKCKECAKKDVKDNYKKLIQEEWYVEKQRERGREKYRRLNYRNKKTAHPENRCTRKFLQSKGVSVDGYEVHHWNYHRKNDVFLLGRREHKYVHNYLEFDLENQLFRYNGELLDTKDKHRRVIIELLKRAAEEIPEYDFEDYV